ncbi:hypothetical protein [Streptomyces sp. NPDC102476]|uniref:hypothetical protein n=1 Tax=Streptomyces sp. NPDC102476 TaxID=3366181 RepID=UPI00381D2D29
MTLDLNSRTWGPQDEATPAEKTAATRYVASIATSPADCRHLLDVLGLLPRRRITEHGMTGYRQGCRCALCKRANTARNRRQRAAHKTTTRAEAS